MTKIRYADKSFELEPNQSVLECLSSRGFPIPNSCRAGVCQTCLMRATKGKPPSGAQLGLKESFKLRDYFLACVCHPTDDMDVALPEEAEPSVQATVRKLELLNDNIMLVELECPEPLDYRAGQFINLVHDTLHVRSYSIASVARLDKYIQLHVRRLPQGRVSTWIHEDLKIGHRIEIRGPAGDCFYVPGTPEQPLMLVGTGSGLAPLYGILRDALDLGHTGPVSLYHGARDKEGLYLIEELRELERRFANFTYTPCLSGKSVPAGFAAGRVNEVIFDRTPNLKGCQVYLCGHPEMVNSARKRAFLAGASLLDIHADAFNVSHS